MTRGTYALLLGTAFLAACGGVSRTVDSPPIDVRTALAANAATLGFADQLVGASHSTELTDKGITWHFTVNNQDYGRYVITIADKPKGSKVSAKFEEVDGPTNSAVPFLRDTARTISQETLLATLEHRAINAATWKRSLIVNAVRNPAAVAGMQQAVMAEAVNAMHDMNSGSYTGPQHYDQGHGYDKTANYDRDRVTQYEAEKRRAEIRDR
jgi:hypothetical protein